MQIIRKINANYKANYMQIISKCTLKMMLFFNTIHQYI